MKWWCVLYLSTRDIRVCETQHCIWKEIIYIYEGVINDSKVGEVSAVMHCIYKDFDPLPRIELWNVEHGVYIAVSSDTVS